jgi:hypothetical protein
MMKQKTSEKKGFDGLSRGWWTLLMTLMPFVFFGVVGLGFYAIIEYLHYSVGILLAFFSLAAGSGSISGVIRGNWIDKEENPDPEASFISSISMSVTSIFIFTAIGAWISYALYALGIVELLMDSGIPTYGNLVQTYLWHLANLIPFINVEKTFGMKDPIVQFTGWIAGLPILAFRFAVVVIIFGAIQETWKIFQKSSEEALWHRLKKRIDADSLVGKGENLGKIENRKSTKSTALGKTKA